jgi:hypothetical protein
VDAPGRPQSSDWGSALFLTIEHHWNNMSEEDRCLIDLEPPEREIYQQIKLEKALKDFERKRLNSARDINSKKDVVIHRLNLPQALINLRSISAEDPDFSEELTAEDLELLPVRADIWVGDMITRQVARIKEKAKAKKA